MVDPEVVVYVSEKWKEIASSHTVNKNISKIQIDFCGNNWGEIIFFFGLILL